MKNPPRKNMRILGIAPSTRGVGFAVLDGETLFDWGLRSIKGGDKNRQSLLKVEKLITRYLPDKIIIEDYWTKGSRRAPRIQELGERILALAGSGKLKVKTIPRRRIFQMFLGAEQGTKHDVAKALTARFPEELDHRLPPKRRAWMSEDCRMDIFAAVALAVTWR